MSTHHDDTGTEAARARRTEVAVRDRADVRRQVKMVVVFGLALLAGGLLLALHRRRPRALRRARQRRRVLRRGPGQGADRRSTSPFVADHQHRADRAGLRARRGQPGAARRAGACSSILLVGAAFFVSFYLWNFVDQTAQPADHGRRAVQRRAQPGHPAHARGARRLPLRARRRHQHRDRGPAPRSARSCRPRSRPWSHAACPTSPPPGSACSAVPPAAR